METLFNKIWIKFLSYLETRGRKIRNRINRKRLKNHDFSIIASTCNGGVIAHDLGMRFNTPFVNIFILPEDYIKLLKNPKYYIYDNELEFSKTKTVNKYSLSEKDNYPVAKLDDITLFFPHDHTEKEAAENWNKRKGRIKWDNLFIMFTDRDSCSYELIKEFDQLPYENKVIFTNKPYPEFKSAFYIRGFELEKCVGICSEYKNKFGKRYLDDFDYVGWLNNGQ